jgi:ribosomal protein S13
MTAITRTCRALAFSAAFMILPCVAVSETHGAIEKRVDTPATAESPNVNDFGALQHRIDDVEHYASTVKDDVHKMQEKLSDESATHFAQLVIIGIGAFGMALTIAAFLGNLWIKDRVSALHEEEIKKTKSTLADMLLTVNADIGANIYATIAGQCIDLYKNIPKPARGGVHHELYNSYVNMAVTIATVGHAYSNKLQEQLANQRDAQLTAKEKERYGNIKSVNLNNYLFYLAQRGRKQDKALVSELLPALVKIAAEKESQCEKNWWYYKETVLWVKLHLGRATARETREAVQHLLDLDEVDYDWKKDTVAHYDLYNRLCANAADKVVLAPPPAPA